MQKKRLSGKLVEFDFRMLTCLPVLVISKKNNFKCKSKNIKKIEEICYPEFCVCEGLTLLMENMEKADGVTMR